MYMISFQYYSFICIYVSFSIFIFILQVIRIYVNNCVMLIVCQCLFVDYFFIVGKLLLRNLNLIIGIKYIEYFFLDFMIKRYGN